VRVAALVAMSHHTGLRLAEVGFLLILIGGVWLALTDRLDPERWHRTAVAGALFAAAGVLLIVATHWGGFG
jgi:drug/metabolite transporter superfamily protein YnfA